MHHSNEEAPVVGATQGPKSANPVQESQQTQPTIDANSVQICAHPRHPLAALFPNAAEDEFSALVQDLKASGLRHPIEQDQHGRIVDGWQRLRACEAAGVDPRFNIVNFDDDAMVLRYLASVNLHRRNLDPVKRAFVACRIQEKLRAQAEENRKRGAEVPANLPGGDTRDLAAKAAGGVASRSVDLARKAIATDPKIEELVYVDKIVSMPEVQALLDLDSKDRTAVLRVVESGRNNGAHEKQELTVKQAVAMLRGIGRPAMPAALTTPSKRSGGRYSYPVCIVERWVIDGLATCNCRNCTGARKTLSGAPNVQIERTGNTVRVLVEYILPDEKDVVDVEPEASI